MAPRKLINKSRPVGGKKRGRPLGSKNKPKPQDIPTPTSTTSSEPADSPVSTPQDFPVVPLIPAKSNGTNGSHAPLNQAQIYTGLSQIPHGLTFPIFDPNSYFAIDLFTNSSSLPETEKEDADKAVESIEKKRQTLRIVGANIALNTDVVKTGNEYRKLEGFVIDYDTTRINNETKFVNWQTAEVNRGIAINRFEQTQERLIQGQKVLAGMRSITPLIDDEWQERKSLKLLQIQSLKVAAIQAKEALEPKMLQISQNFRQELDDLN